MFGAVVRRNSAGRTAIRSAVGRLLDLEFEHSARLPALPDGLVRARADDFIAVPAPEWFEPGNQSYRGLIHLVLIARAVNARRILEIGTYNGLTTLTLAVNLPEAVVHTLDLPPFARPELPLEASDRANIGQFDRRLFEETAVAERIVQHLGDSATFDFGSLGGAFDMVYIDGAHSPRYVENDTQAAFSIISNDGAIVWDDYWRPLPAVASFLQTLEDRTIYRIPGTRLAAWFGNSLLP
jgi:hypothetical protein